jgi:hypothetical protein
MGFIGGLLFALVTFPIDPRPFIIRVLAYPLVLLCAFIDEQHVTPGESLVGLFFVVPLWFIYWGCLGAGAVLLVRWLRCRVKRHDATTNRKLGDTDDV